MGSQLLCPAQVFHQPPGGDPSPAFWAGTGSFQSHGTILQFRRLQPPSALMEPLTPGRAGFMTTSLLTAIRGCDVFPASHRQWESRSVQCLLTDQRCRVSKPGRVPTRQKHLIPASPNPRTNRTPVLTQCTFNVYLLHTQGPFTDRF